MELSDRRTANLVIRLLVGLALLGFGVWLVVEGYAPALSDSRGGSRGATLDSVRAAFGTVFLVLGALVAFKAAREYLRA